jgi:hypothetical protein
LAGSERERGERESGDSVMRQIEFLDSEIAEVERPITADALRSPEIRRLMGGSWVNEIVSSRATSAWSHSCVSQGRATKGTSHISKEGSVCARRRT